MGELSGRGRTRIGIKYASRVANCLQPALDVYGVDGCDLEAGTLIILFDYNEPTTVDQIHEVLHPPFYALYTDAIHIH
jgi:hypothetical protein